MATKTFNISLPDELVKQVDSLAKERFTSRSDVIREVLLDRLALRARLDSLYTAGAKYGKKSGINTEADVARAIKEVRKGK